jgi:hypothetical protein
MSAVYILNSEDFSHSCLAMLKGGEILIAGTMAGYSDVAFLCEKTRRMSCTLFQSSFCDASGLGRLALPKNGEA